jgi:predicted O-linked N-acetylglucosamine transferase (SPINDLY family)
MSDPRLQAAMQLRRAGRFADAARLYGEILASEPRHFEALHALGIVSYQMGQIEDAERLIGLAVEVNPSAADAHYNRACLLQKMNRLAAALSSFDQALVLKPNYLEALVNKASTLAALQRHEEALFALDQVIALNGNIPEVWNNRASALIALGRPEEAVESYGRALALRPSFAEAWNSRAGVLMALGRAPEALECFEKLLALDPSNADALKKSADTLLVLKRNRDAAERYGRYLARKPDDGDAWANNGIALVEMERYADGLAAFEKALALNPGNADAWNYRGNVLFQLKRYDEAAESYERALSLAPDLPYGAGYLAQSRLRCCDWSRFADDRARIAEGLRAGHPVIDPFGNLAVSESPADQLRCARITFAEIARLGSPRLWQGERYRHEKIRLAYLSADFRPHPVAFLIAGVFEHHDKSRFETIGLSFGPKSDSDIRRRMSGAFDRFIDVREESDSEIAAMMRRMEIDIAVDLTGLCEHGRTEILAFRPAPVQVNYLGFPGTSGADFVDYIIADETIVPPDQARFFTEQVVYLPDTYQANDRKRGIARRLPTKRELGLPEVGMVFCAFNNAYKITPTIFDLWMDLLRDTPGSVLWLLGDNTAAVRNLTREAGARGIEAARLIFAPRVAPEDHLARFGQADLFLDTLPYNAHTTASDALWTGVPVVTCTGEAFAGRVATSLLKAAGLPELVTRTLEEYRTLALGLGRDRTALDNIKEKLRLARAASPLFDTARFTGHLEAAYGEMWRRQQRGEAPSSFTIAQVLA